MLQFVSFSGAASDKASSKATLVGPCPSLFLSHDPTHSRRILPALQPDEDDVLALLADKKRPRVLLESLMVVSVLGEGVLEQASSEELSGMRTVSSEMAWLDETYKPRNVKLGARTKLRALNLPAVHCSESCEPDAVYYIEAKHVRRVLAVYEFKAPGVAPGVAFQQAAKYACAAAAGLCQGGVIYDEEVVPLMVSTGLLELHGAAYMVDRLLPSSIETSPTLDLTSERGVAATHLYRMKAAEKVKRSASLVCDALDSSALVELRRQLFPGDGGEPAVPVFLPGFTENAIWLKWGAVSSPAPRGLDAQLAHLYRAFRALYASDASPFVCFPFCYAARIKSATAGPSGVAAMLFPNLKSAGYRSSLPDTIQHARMYVAAIAAATSAIHAAGLIHGDLYVTNIMWRLCSDGHDVKVKVIERDTVFFSGDEVPKHWASIWKETQKWRLYKKRLSQKVVKSDAICSLDHFMVDTLRYFCSDDEELWKLWMAAADEALGTGELIEAFLTMQEMYATHERLSSLEGCSAG